MAKGLNIVNDILLKFRALKKDSVIVLGFLVLLSIFQLWVARGTLQPAFYLNDSAMHEQMVRFAANALRHGHFPMDRWYPGLDLGSPQFLHYQGLAATLVGALGLVISPNVGFRWSLYLLWSFWPVAVYGAARTFRLPRRASLGAAVAGACLFSVPLVGYEIGAYMWAGYGIWAQLCASWALPFAWAWTWRAMEDRRYVVRAVLFISLTAALHFETGYSAFLAIPVMLVLVRTNFGARAKSAAAIGIGSILGTSWITVPLLLNAKWAAINTALASTGLVRGYGASKNISWLLHGHLFDDRRFPIITLVFAAGAIFAVWRWKRFPPARAFITMFVVTFLVSFGPTTWGKFIALLPGHADIYFRRFLLSVQLSALFAVGAGVAASGDLLERVVVPRVRSLFTGRLVKRRISGWGSVAVGALVVWLAFPAVTSYGANNDALASTQVREQQAQAVPLAPILAYIRAHPLGRVYAGSIVNWGANFNVGQVQMNIYLADNDIDEVGFVLRTAALMEQPEYNFNDHNAGAYAIMGIHYILTPVSMQPPVPAQSVMVSGNYHLWALPHDGYFDLLNNAGTIDENKGTVSIQSYNVLDTGLLARHDDYLVHWNASDLAVTTAPVRVGAPGTIRTSAADLANGTGSATVTMARPGILELSASFDPGWTVMVDGKAQPTVMVAPAVVGVELPAGTHQVTFVYKGFGWYWLLALAVLLGFAGSFFFSRRSPNLPVTQ